MNDAQREAAICRQADPDLWFPEKYTGDNGLAAKKLCRVCPSRLACLQDAIREKEPDGIWAGFAPHARAKMTIDTAQAFIDADNEAVIIKAEREAQRRRDKSDREKALRAAHAAFVAGQRDLSTRAGEQEYQAYMYQQRKYKKRTKVAA